jgi:hypothetical protein
VKATATRPRITVTADGRAISDIAVLVEQPELFGSVASDSTC